MATYTTVPGPKTPMEVVDLGGRQDAPASLTIEWLRSPDRLESISGHWRALESEVRTRTHLTAFDFLSTWYRHYAGAYGGEPLIGLAWRGARLVGVAPLAMRRGSLGWIPLTRVEFAPTDTPAGEFLVEDGHPEIVSAFLDSLVHTVKFDLICLDGHDPASEQLVALQTTAANLRLTTELTDHAFAVADLRRGYQAYHSSLSGHYRRNLKNRAGRIATTGEAIVGGIQLTEGIEAMENCIARMIAITEASYKLQGQRLADNHRGYLAELVRRFGPRGMLSLPILSIGGKDAAFILGVVERGCFYDITLAYDESFEKLSPGAFLMQKTLENLAAAGVHTVVSHGAHEYKKHWATTFVAQKRMFLFAPGMRAALSRFVHFTMAPLWRRFRPTEPDI